MSAILSKGSRLFGRDSEEIQFKKETWENLSRTTGLDSSCLRLRFVRLPTSCYDNDRGSKEGEEKKMNIYLTRVNRSSSCCNLRILLAENILGFPDQEPRCRRKTFTDPANHKFGLWPRHVCLGVAIRSHRWLSTTSKHRGKINCVANGWVGSCIAVSSYESGDLL